MNSHEVTITTIKELVDTATSENLANLIQDLYHFIILAKNTELSINYSKFVWVDDGKNDVILTNTGISQEVLNEIPEGFTYEEDSNQIRNGNIVIPLSK